MANLAKKDLELALDKRFTPLMKVLNKSLAISV
jgi:hypothetical protein